MILHLERRECQSIDVEGIMVLDGNNHNKREVVCPLRQNYIVCQEKRKNKSSIQVWDDGGPGAYKGAGVRPAESGDTFENPPGAERLSLLEVKDQLLLLYVVDESAHSGQSLRGSLQGHAAVLRLVEIRTVLEKLCPWDQKLKY
ncbi:hypothetical protein QTO34_013152 [Cnephaeus nilssonii]|uniref:Uncharacterized protein n=1 Tax=Cnephaeus nilssonii TaxID=3371016 RepID=A0AA40I7P9_CNENI|nr:hypothetical protein QTO34_013152 [Eptesicus nilssonii]